MLGDCVQESGPSKKVGDDDVVAGEGALTLTECLCMEIWVVSFYIVRMMGFSWQVPRFHHGIIVAFKRALPRCRQ